MKDNTAGILILEKGGGGYIVILQPPPGEDVEVFMAGRGADPNDNCLYRMEQTPETATMDDFGEVKRRETPEPVRKKPTLEVVVDND